MRPLGLRLPIFSCQAFGSAEELLWNEVDQGRGVDLYIPAEPDGNAASLYRLVKASLPSAQIAAPARRPLFGIENDPTLFTHHKPQQF